MTIKDFVSEAISSGKYRREKEIVTDSTTFDEFCETLEKCGINWHPGNHRTIPDKTLIYDALDKWNYQYDTFLMSIGITSVVIVTHEKCFVIDWSTKSKNTEGPAGGMYYKTFGPTKVKVTSELEETLKELNKELDDDLF